MTETLGLHKWFTSSLRQQHDETQRLEWEKRRKSPQKPQNGEKKTDPADVGINLLAIGHLRKLVPGAMNTAEGPALREAEFKRRQAQERKDSK